MGYYTDFNLTVEYQGNADERNLAEIKKQLNADIDNLGIFEPGWGSTNWWANAKWYESETDMRALSKRYPDFLFTLDGNGEDREDMWVEYYLNGKMQRCAAQITYDDFDPDRMS